MDLDWTLIEYRPGRYAKVSRDGAFLGSATEAEVRAWFAASAPPTGQGAAPPSQDASQPAATPSSQPGGARARPDSPEDSGIIPELEVPWEKSLIWAPPRPDREDQERSPTTKTLGPGEDDPRSETPDHEIRDAQPESDESWARPMLWAPPRAGQARQPRAPETRTPDPREDDPGSESTGSGVQDTQPKPEESWARPMIWGRPPADPQTRKSGEEKPSLTAEPESVAPTVASLNAGHPDPTDKSHEMEQDSSAAGGQPPFISDEPHSEPDVVQRGVEAGAGSVEPASPTAPARSIEAEMIEEEAGLTAARPAVPGPEAPGPRVEAERVEKGPAIPKHAEPEPVHAQLGIALTEAASPDARGLDTGAAAVQVAMVLTGLESIAPDTPESRPEPEPDEPGKDLAILEPAGPGDLEPSPEPEAGDEQAEGAGSEPAVPQTEESGPMTGLDGAAPPIISPKLDGLDAEEIQAEPEGPDEELEILSGKTHRPELKTEPGPVEEDPVGPTPEPALLDAEEERPEEQILDERRDATPPKAEDGEFEPGPDDFTSLPALATSAVSIDTGLDTGASGTQSDVLEPDSPGAGELWLWVDPRYEGGYSPATFDLFAFLQRAMTLFQGKPWTGGNRPAKIAVHSEAAHDLESMAESLGLTVVEDTRVSSGTYWLGLGADGQPAVTPGSQSSLEPPQPEGRALR